MSRLWLAVAAALIGVTVVAVEGLLFSGLTAMPLTFAQDVAPVNALIAAAPFFLLALLNERRKQPWLVGLALTVLVWGYLLFDDVAYQWNPNGSGANIGLGILMLFSPILISAAVLMTRTALRA